MKKVNLSDIQNYKGKFLSRDVYYNGRLVFQSSSLINDDLINKIARMSYQVFFLFVYDADIVVGSL